MMRIIKFIILISFLFNSAAYPCQNISGALRPNLMTDKGKGAQRLQDMAAQVILKDTKPPSVSYVEKVTDAYDAAKAGDYDKSYELLMEGLLGEDSVVSLETAIGVLQALQAHYGTAAQKGKELGGMLTVMVKHKTDGSQAQMKARLRQYRDSLAKKKKPGIHNYKPGWTLVGWEYAKKAIEERFKTAKERRKALKFVRNLAIGLADDKRIDPTYVLQYVIPAITNAAKNTDVLEEALPFIENLIVKLADKEIYPTDTLGYGIPAIVKIAKNIDELKLFIDFAIRLADNRIDPTYTLRYGIPAAANAAKTLDELKLFIDFAVRLADKRIYPAYALQYSFPAIAKVAKNIDELKEVLPLIENFAIRLADKWVNPAHALQYGIPAIAKLAKDIDELREALPSIENLAIRLADKEIYPTDTLEYGIPAAANAVKTIDELKLFIDLAIRLADKRIDPAYALQYGVPAIAELAKTPQELKDMCDILFDLNIKLAKNDPKLLHLVISAISGGHIAKALELKKNYGDFSVKCVIERRYSIIPEYQESRIIGYETEKEMPYDYTTWIQQHQEAVPIYEIITIPEHLLRQGRYVSSINIYPLTHLTQLTVTHVLFIDTEVVKNLAGFKEALRQLRNNEGNVPVVLLTQETKDSIIANLEGIDLAGVQFRTQAELGLQDLKWDENEWVSLIDGINSLRCIPLAKPLSDAFKDLQKTRNQV